jgi:hypothetical protein
MHAGYIKDARILAGDKSTDFFRIADGLCSEFSKETADTPAAAPDRIFYDRDVTGSFDPALSTLPRSGILMLIFAFR